MTTIDRTAYPQWPSTLTERDLSEHFTPTTEQIKWAHRAAKSRVRVHSLLVLTKCHEYLHYFPKTASVPATVLEHVAKALGLSFTPALYYGNRSQFKRDCETVRKHLGVRGGQGGGAMQAATTIALDAAILVATRIDVINAMVEGLVSEGFELPPFHSLDRLAEKVHTAAIETLLWAISTRLTNEHKRELDGLLTRQFDKQRTLFHKLKQHAKRATRDHLAELTEHLEWLDRLIDPTTLFEGVPPAKRKHLAQQAFAMDAAELKDLKPTRRYAFVLALIYEMRISVRDDLATMFVNRVAMMHKTAKQRLENIKLQRADKTENLVARFEDVLEIFATHEDDLEAGRETRKLLSRNVSLEDLLAECADVRASSGSNYFHLLWPCFRSYRSVLFKIIRLLDLEATTQDRSLLDALAVVRENETKKSLWIDAPLTLSFAQKAWHRLVKPEERNGQISRRDLEVCVFSHLATDLRSGDIAVTGAEEYSDYRKSLLPWDKCEPLLDDYCTKAGVPRSAAALVEQVRTALEEAAKQLDERFPEHSGDVVIGSDGVPILCKPTPNKAPPSAEALEQAIKSRMPSRNLIDILTNVENLTGFCKFFGPLSGNDPKLPNPRERYLITTFAYGSNMGPTQAARHFINEISAHQISFVNRRHISLDALDSAIRLMTEVYARLDLPTTWGDLTEVAADGTHYGFYDQNLLSGYHFRYRKTGAVAYRHVATNYIAVFRHFMPPGMQEAVYVIEGLLNSGLSVSANRVFSDTHGQTETVFAFTFLAGAELMPRIAGWKDLRMYRASSKRKYRHIDRLFTDTIDWALIQDHWQDLMQVAISIQQGRVASPLLLRRLSYDGRHNRLFRAARELGRALRTIYLLRWIGSKELRQRVTAETNKIESYHSFSKWLSFGGEVIAVNDPLEQQKRLRYIDLVASAVIVQNVLDMSYVISQLLASGVEVSKSDVAYLSPFLIENIKRFGDYLADLNRPLDPWLREAALRKIVRDVQIKASETTQ
jgi:TnpA family transposase